MLSLLPLLLVVSAVTELDHSCEEEGFVCKFPFEESGMYVFQQQHEEITRLEVDRFPDSTVDVTNLLALQRLEIGGIDLLPDDLCRSIILGSRCVEVWVTEDTSKNRLCCPSSTTAPASHSHGAATATLAPSREVVPTSTPSHGPSTTAPASHSHGAATATLAPSREVVPTSTPSHGPSSQGVASTTTTNDRVTFTSITDKTAYDNTLIVIVVACLIIILIIILVIICIIRQCRRRRRRSSQSQVNIEMGVPSNPLPLDESGSEDTLFDDIMPTSSATSHDKHE